MSLNIVALETLELTYKVISLYFSVEFDCQNIFFPLTLTI
jgi:hypothetical protein